MVQGEFEKVVRWCCLVRKFNVKRITDGLLKSDEAYQVFGGIGGFMGHVAAENTESEALTAFCIGWILLRNNQSIIHFIDAAKQIGDTNLADDLEKEFNNCLNAQKTEGPIYRTAQTNLLGDETIMSDSEYVSRPELEEEIKARTWILGCSSDRGILLIHGDGGIGKTTLLRKVLSRDFLTECGFAVRAWLNVYKASNSSESEPNNVKENRLFQRLAELLQVGETPQHLICYLQKLATEGKRILFVLDDVFDADYLWSMSTLPVNVRVICVSRRNFSLEIRKLFSHPAIHVREMSDKSIAKMFSDCSDLLESRDLEYLLKLCSGLALVAQVIKGMLLVAGPSGKRHAAGIVKKIREEEFPHLLKLDAMDDGKREKEIWKLLLIGFRDEAVEFRRRYYAFLLFDEASDVEIEDLSILWQCDNNEAGLRSVGYYNRALVRSNEEKTKFSVHGYLFGAALEFLVTQEKENADLISCLGQRRLFTVRKNLLLSTLKSENCENALHVAVKGQRYKLLRIIMAMIREDEENKLVFGLCGQLSLQPKGRRLPKHMLGRLPLHLFVETKWQRNGMNFGLDYGCFLANHLLLREKTEANELLCFSKSFNGLTVLQLLLENVNNSKNGKWHENALLLCAGREYRELFKLLIDKGADEKNTVDENGNNALLIAANNFIGTIAIDLLKRENFDVNFCNKEGKTALMIASFKGDYSSCQVLLKSQNVNVNAQDNFGNTALIMASQAGQLITAQQLLQAGADVSIRNRKGDNALWLAMLKNNIEVAELIRTSGENLTRGEFMALSMNSRLQNQDRTEKLLRKWGQDLRFSEEVDYEEAVDPLLKLIDIERPQAGSVRDRVLKSVYIDDSSQLQLQQQGLKRKSRYMAAILATYLGRTNCLRILEQTLKLEKDERENLLLTAAFFGQPTIVSYLLSENVSTNARATSEATPLCFASQNGHVKVVELLLEHYADVNAKTNNSATPLLVASNCGHAEVVELLLKHNADVNAKSNIGATPLFQASHNGHVKVVELLLQHNADVSARSSDDATPIFMASQCGHVEIVKMLLDHNADVNAKAFDDTTPLLLASQNGHVKVVELLLEHKADVNAKRHDDATPLFAASQNGHVEVVELLLESDANVDAKNNDNVTPIFLASQCGHEMVVELLLEYGADANAKNGYNLTPMLFASQNGHAKVVELLLKNNAEADPKTNDNVTPLIAASKNGHVTVVELLLNHHANVNVKRNDDATPLFFASQNGHVQVVKLLLDHSADVNAARINGSTPLFLASQNGHVNVVEVLLEHQADVNATNNDNVTPLFFASQNGHVNVVELLLKRQADVNAKSNNNVTPMFLVSQNGHEEILELLLKHNANVNVKRNDDATPLFAACQNGHVKVVEMLLERKADVNAKRNDNATPLFFPSHDGNVKLVEMLIKHQADVNAENNENVTPLFFASQNGHAEVVELLLKHAANVNAKTIEDATPLFAASQNGHVKIVELLLDCHADVNSKTIDDATAMSAASKNGHVKVVELLLEHNADVNLKTKDDATSAKKAEP